MTLIAVPDKVVASISKMQTIVMPLAVHLHGSASFFHGFW